MHRTSFKNEQSPILRAPTRFADKWFRKKWTSSRQRLRYLDTNVRLFVSSSFQMCFSADCLVLFGSRDLSKGKFSGPKWWFFGNKRSQIQKYFLYYLFHIKWYIIEFLQKYVFLLYNNYTQLFPLVLLIFNINVSCL